MILNRMYYLNTLCCTVWVIFLLSHCSCSISLFDVFQNFLYGTGPNEILVLFYFSPHHSVNGMQKLPDPLCRKSLGKNVTLLKRRFYVQKFEKMNKNSLLLFFQSLAVFFIDCSFCGSPSHFCVYCRRRTTTGSSTYQKSRKTPGFDSGKEHALGKNYTTFYP